MHFLELSSSDTTKQVLLYLRYLGVALLKILQGFLSASRLEQSLFFKAKKLMKCLLVQCAHDLEKKEENNLENSQYLPDTGIVKIVCNHRLKMYLMMLA
jgi:hypothetical protein